MNNLDNNFNNTQLSHPGNNPSDFFTTAATVAGLVATALTAFAGIASAIESYRDSRNSDYFDSDYSDYPYNDTRY